MSMICCVQFFIHNSADDYMKKVGVGLVHICRDFATPVEVGGILFVRKLQFVSCVCFVLTLVFIFTNNKAGIC